MNSLLLQQLDSVLLTSLSRSLGCDFGDLGSILKITRFFEPKWLPCSTVSLTLLFSIAGLHFILLVEPLQVGGCYPSSPALFSFPKQYDKRQVTALLQVDGFFSTMIHRLIIVLQIVPLPSLVAQRPRDLPLFVHGI